MPAPRPRHSCQIVAYSPRHARATVLFPQGRGRGARGVTRASMLQMAKSLLGRHKGGGEGKMVPPLIWAAGPGIPARPPENGTRLKTLPGRPPRFLDA
eukprot:gene9158-biopygen13742